MVLLQHTQRRQIQQFFAENEETMLLSYFQGHMGQGWADNVNSPACGLVVVADFCFLGGDSTVPGAMELVEYLRRLGKKYLLVLPLHQGWYSLIEACYSGNCKQFHRIATHKDTQFDVCRLQVLASQVPQGYQIVPIGEKEYQKVQGSARLGDLCSQFSTAEDYRKRGLGFVALHGGQPVGGASSYTVYDSGIEIEIDVLPAHRGKGLAKACGAALILECLRRGLYPSWDAMDNRSVSLAEHFGYRRAEAYVTYEITLG